jgi:hypothetical protein
VYPPERSYFRDQQRVDATSLRGGAAELSLVVERGEHGIE